jgi:hypothetical protein
MITVQATGFRELEQQLTAIQRTQLPYATMVALNKTGSGMMTKVRATMGEVFDRPTPFSLKKVAIGHWATKTQPWLDIGLGETPQIYDAGGPRQISHLEPHVPGYPSTRKAKGAENWLRGPFMREDQWLMPARNYPFNRYGNVRGPTMQKMLADIDAYSRNQYRPAITQTRLRGNRRRRGRPVAGRIYMWGTMTSKKGRLFSGIFSISGGADNWERGRWKLRMIAVDKAPSYEKRFNFIGIGQKYANTHLLPNLRTAVENAIRTMR